MWMRRGGSPFVEIFRRPAARFASGTPDPLALAPARCQWVDNDNVQRQYGERPDRILAVPQKSKKCRRCSL